jgi:N-acetylneuraminate synthase
MKIDSQLTKYIVFSHENVLTALKKISNNQKRIIFALSDSGLLEGVMTEGDFRRWLINQESLDLNAAVSQVCNKNFKFAFWDDDRSTITSYFSKEIELIPLLDRQYRLVAIASPEEDIISIGKFVINGDSPALIIAEIGNNHNGSLEMAKKLIDRATESGANCVKFQMRHVESLYQNAGNASDAKEDLGTQYVLDLLSRFQLTPTEMFLAFDYCQKRDVLPLCTPWDIASLEILESYGMVSYKVASADLTNHDFLRALARTNKPLICSTGMSTEDEIKEAIAILNESQAKYILLHCNSTYPAPFKDINLNYLDKLKELSNSPLGYSGHERGINVAIAAVAKGAKVIEKHLTLDRTLEGNDHKVSLLPEEFQAMVEGIRQVEAAMGTTAKRTISQGELINRITLAKSLIINCDLKRGEIIKDDMISIKSPGRGLQPNAKNKLIGRRAIRDFKSGSFFFASDILEEQIQPRNYSFNRPWGIPVRYHDFATILDKSNPNFLEFHLSYKDLDENLNLYFKQKYNLGLVVHSPDFFGGDFLLNLCASNLEERQRSIEELQSVVKVTQALKKFFKNTSRTFVVVSLGGYTRDKHLQESQRGKLYEIIAESLSKIETEGVEIIAQTLPPFPWYFGGQLYLNLFVGPEDTAEFCRQYGYRLCLDISHAKLACNYFHWSFKEYVEKVAPYSVHLHVADAAGVDGEGLQIGSGDIDFPSLAENLNKLMPNISFIPEIWQGHQNGGEGFWMALEKLEKFL